MNNDINHPLAKFLAALGTLATMDFWSSAGKLAAALLSIAMLSEWIWKRLIKPAGKRMGWVEETAPAPLDK